MINKNQDTKNKNPILLIVMRFIKKLFFYFLLFTGIILSTSHLGDNYMGISDEEGYLLTIGVCCLTAFFWSILFQNCVAKTNFKKGWL